MGISFIPREVDHGWERIRSLARSLKQGGSYAKAGVLDGAAREGTGQAEALTNAELAAVHEFGAPSVGIPERSFIRGPFDAHREDYTSALGKLLGKALEGEKDFAKALGIVGQMMARDMRAAITRSSGGYAPFPPNSPATIEKKGSSRPLIDSGQLRRAVTSTVVIQDIEKPAAAGGAE